MSKQKKKVIRVAVLILALLNVVLASFGLSPVDLSNEALTNAINDIWAVGMALWCCWKNCSITQPHLKADAIAEHIKQGAEIIIQYQAGGEFAETGSAEEHEINDPEDAEVI